MMIGEDLVGGKSVELNCPFFLSEKRVKVGRIQESVAITRAGTLF